MGKVTRQLRGDEGWWRATLCELPQRSMATWQQRRVHSSGVFHMQLCSNKLFRAALSSHRARSHNGRRDDNADSSAARVRAAASAARSSSARSQRQD